MNNSRLIILHARIVLVLIALFVGCTNRHTKLNVWVQQLCWTCSQNRDYFCHQWYSTEEFIVKWLRNLNLMSKCCMCAHFKKPTQEKSSRLRLSLQNALKKVNKTIWHFLCSAVLQCSLNVQHTAVSISSDQWFWTLRLWLGSFSLE